MLEARSMRWFRDHYLRGEADRLDWRAAPLRAGDLGGLPPAWGNRIRLSGRQAVPAYGFLPFRRCSRSGTPSRPKDSRRPLAR